MGAEFWTEERIALMFKLLREGRSSAEVGALMGVGKGTITGKVKRLGYKASELNGYKNHPGKMIRKGKGLAAKPEYQAYIRKNQEKYRQQLSRYKRVKEGAGKRGPYMRKLKITELTSFTCRWPLWEDEGDPKVYCGRDCNVLHPYCKHHTELATRPDRPHLRREPSRPFVIRKHPRKSPKSIAV